MHIEEKTTKPHVFIDSPFDGYCGLCRMSKNYRIHQPRWWRWLNLGRSYR